MSFLCDVYREECGEKAVSLSLGQGDPLAPLARLQRDLGPSSKRVKIIQTIDANSMGWARKRRIIGGI